MFNIQGVERDTMQHVIIGAGPAGVVAAESIRKFDKSSTVTLVSNESERPYSRLAIPRFLQGVIAEKDTYLRCGQDYFASQSIDVRRGCVVKVDSRNDSVNLADGTRLEYDRLLIATGCRPEKPAIPGTELPGVVNCWTLEDARKIVCNLGINSRLIVVGGGFIGFVIIDALARTGAHIDVIEKGNRVLPHSMNDESSRLIQSWCDKKGIEVKTCVDIEAIERRSVTSGNAGSGSHLSVLLDNGDTLDADMVIFTTGTKINTKFLEGSQIAFDHGVLVDERLNTNMPNVFAAGDACQGLGFSTGGRRVQAVQLTASEHGRIAAANMCGFKARYSGSITMNVLDTLGLVSSSFGAWNGVEGGESVTYSLSGNYTYLNLQFSEDKLVGGSCIGNAECLQQLPRLIHAHTPLKEWKKRLMDDPCRLGEAYHALSQANISNN
ncbi:MAG: FAD/NAD(P)-binding oxidoreductase [Candidatus Thiodiazotropha sp.]